MKRAVVLVLDGVGIGELPDAGQYGDTGSNTLGNLARACGGLALPVLEQLGLGNISVIDGVRHVSNPRACFGKMAEQSAGKDSTSGHWELFGLIIEKPFPTYPHGFPPDIITAFESRIGHAVLGNIPASGTSSATSTSERRSRLSTPRLIVSSRLRATPMFSASKSSTRSAKLRVR
jgi:phosphopentomutase